MRCLNLIVAFLLVVSVVSQDAGARTYSVSPTGSDGGAGSLASPWRTLGRAASGLQPGDTVLVRGGLYHERFQPSNSGTLLAPIVYRAYPGETVQIDGETNGSLNVISVWGNYVIIEGFLVTNQNYYKAPANRTYWVALEGNYLALRHCRVVASGDVWDNIYVKRAESRGIVVAGHHTVVEHCYVRGHVMGIAIAGPSPRHVIIRYDTVHASGQNNIDVTSTEGGETAYHATLIEHCQLDTSFIEDNIQFEPDYGDPTSTLHNRGTIIRYNVMGNAAENAIDLKGAGHTIIDNNYIYSSSGDDDGALGGHDTGSGGGVTSNPNNPTRYTIIRGNVIWDHCTAMEMAEGDHYFNNTILNNRRTWQGPNQTGIAHTAIRAWNYPNYKRAFINNIVCAQPNIGVYNWLMDHGAQFTLNNNLYYDSSAAPRFYHRMNGSLVTTVGVQNWKNALATNGGYAYMEGKDAGAIEADPQFVRAPIYAWGYDPSWDFSLASTSPAIDAGTSVTTATAAGNNATQLVVDDAYFFFDGFGITAGDMIMIGGGTPVLIASINYQTNVITLSEPRTWVNGAGVHLAYEGDAPDVGAFEYSAGGISSDPPVAPSLVYPSNNTIGLSLASYLSWAPTPRALSYEIQISLSASFTTLSVSVSGLTSATFPIASLAGSTQYFWRVRATGSAGVGAWSSVRQFSTVAASGGSDKDQPSVVLNGGFESGTSNWAFYTNGAATMTTSSNAVEGVSAVQIGVESAGSNTQLYQTGISLEADTYYKLSFSAYANTGHDLAINLMQHGSPYANYGLLNRVVPLGVGWRTYEVYLKTVNITGSASDGRLQFWFASHAGSGDVYLIDDIQLRPSSAPAIPAQVHCTPLTDSDREFYDRVSIHWPEVALAEGYMVEISANDQFSSLLSAEEVSDTVAVLTSLASSSRYYVRVRAFNVSGSGAYSPTMTVWTTSTKTDVEEGPEVPAAFALRQNYPNPFNPATVIRYTLPSRCDVRLEVFNSLGERVALVDEGERGAGVHEATFSAHGLASGMYFYTLRAGANVETKRMMLLK